VVKTPEILGAGEASVIEKSISALSVIATEVTEPEEGAAQDGKPVAKVNT